MNPVTLGHADNCDIVLDDATLAAVHARAHIDTQGRLWVSDADSQGGTQLGRDGAWARVKTALWREGDRVRLGEREIERAMVLAALAEKNRTRGRGKRIGKRAQGAGEAPKHVFDRPRRNPETGALEEAAPDKD